MKIKYEYERVVGFSSDHFVLGYLESLSDEDKLRIAESGADEWKSVVYENPEEYFNDLNHNGLGLRDEKWYWFLLHIEF